MKIVFMGTPDFAIPSLELCFEEHEVLGVFTQPDRPKGRGKKMAMPPIKIKALEYNLDVYQPESIKTDECFKILSDLKPDCIVVVAYGQILPKRILELPKYGCINVHASILPKYRGASPINWCIVQGEKVTGVTTMYMDEGLDTGNMIYWEKIDISDDMNAGTLHDALLPIGKRVLKKTLKDVEDGIAPSIVQDGESCYAPLLHKKMSIIDWKLDSISIYNQIRGLNPWPVAVSEYRGNKFKIFSSEILSDVDIKNFTEGEIINVDKHGIDVATSDGVIRILELQFAGSKRLHVSQFILGNKIEVGDILG